ncbi:helix-turn-helix domain-containing protein [Kitasatospora indigofera]|uniref:helix-turn-helix domain-containing protein n=1 Tax=Kitasatospora indigofera TaxID=67307 RepID=UPI0036C01E58
MLEKRGVSLAELSRQVGVTVANLSILKNNRARAIRFSTLSAICAVLECGIDDLFRLEESQGIDDRNVGDATS